MKPEGDTSAQRPHASGPMQAVSVAAVVAIVMGIAGLLLVSQSQRNVSHHGLARPSPLASPIASPIANQAMLAEAADVRLSVPSANVVWAWVGGKLLFRSTDRGNSWEQRSLPALRNMRAAEMSFVDDRQGWLFHPGVNIPKCTDSGAEMWHTNDGAATWQQIVVGMWTVSYKSDNAGGDQCKAGLSFIDPTHGFIAGSASGRHPTIYRTVDRGKNWAGVDLPDPPDFTTWPGFSLRAGVVKKFGSTMYVQAWGTQPVQAWGTQRGDIPDRRYVYRSTDGGATWSWMTQIPPTREGMVMVNESRWLELTVPGDSMESTNSGRRWHPFASDFNAATTPVFGDSQAGFADASGALLRTFDGGLHWDRISAPGLPRLALLPITDPRFTCRIAVASSFGYRSKGGFVPVPRGSFQSDPAAGLVTVRGQGWSYETLTQPVLKGTSGLSFDAPFSRWVPASPEVFSSDGSLYVWIEHDFIRDTASAARTAPTPDRIHVTKVADGTDRSFAVARPDWHGPALPVPLGISQDGVLFTYGWEGTLGVWQLDPANGSVTKLNEVRSPTYGSGAIWLSPLRGPNRVGIWKEGDTLARLDQKTGAIQDWFHRDNVAVYPVGFDLEGNPWVQAATFANSGTPQLLEIWRVRGHGQADLILSGQQITRVIADTHGTWFANETGVYLYSSGRVQRVSSASVGEVVGPCVQT